MTFEEWADKNGYAGEFPKKEHMRKSWNAAYNQAISDAVEIIKERGEIVGGAIQPDRLVDEINGLLNEKS